MAIKPILFNTDMVRAILDGRKACTRRAVKHNVKAMLNSQYHMEHPEVEDAWLIKKLCRPPYEPGDILYVRETFMQAAAHTFWYKADDNSWIPEGLHWHPSIHMPKEAALNEVQEYHATGRTPSMVRALQTAYIRAKKRLDKYIAIGTPEQCQEAIAKQIPMKVKEERWMYTECKCGREFSKNHGDGYYSIPKKNKTKYCPDCGQRLMWEPYHITNPDKKEEHNGEESSK